MAESNLTPQQRADLLERGLELRVVSTPPAAAPNRVTLFAVKNTGTGKIEAKAQFPSGAAVVFATEP